MPPVSESRVLAVLFEAAGELDLPLSSRQVEALGRLVAARLAEGRPNPVPTLFRAPPDVTGS